LRDHGQLLSRVRAVQINAAIVVKKKENKYLDEYDIVNCEGETSIGAWDLAESMVLSDARVRLSFRGGKTAAHISGTLRLSGCEGFETGGDLDTEILMDPEDPGRMFLGTLVKNAYLHIGKNISLLGGTIRFEYCSKPYAPGSPLPYQIDEMDELLFQCTDPVPLGAMRIVGVGSNPVTMSMNINALSPGNVRAFISLYPARILVPLFGENTILFLSGEAKDNVVEMDVKNEWSNFISSSPRLHLVDPLDPDGPSLVECTCLLTGRLECKGISHARLSLSSPRKVLKTMRYRLGLTVLSFMILCVINGSGGAGELKDKHCSIDRWPSGIYGVKKDPDIEKKIASMLAKMDLDRKIGQMLQVSIEQCTYDDIKKYHIGSILNGGGSYPHRNKEATVAQWVSCADSFWLSSMADSAVQIPVMWGTDAVHGHNNTRGATIFPHNIGLGAAHDPELIRRIGRITAREVAVTGLDWTFAPVVAAVRDDRWGRTYESWSEKPDIVRQYATSMVQGLQGNFDDEHVIATAKHFIGDGGTFQGIDRGDNRSTEQELIALHAQGYGAALEAGVQTIMVSYSSWNGEAMHGHRYLLTNVLKKRLGFDGIVISDWNGIGEVAGCTNSSCPKAINAGIDMFMIPFAADWKAFIAAVKKQVADGEVPLSRIDDAVARILRVKYRTGLFSKPRPSKRTLANRDTVLGSAGHRRVAREAVRKSLVLLKNKGTILPLSRTARILVAGKSADCIQNQCGGWTCTWQGTDNTNKDFPGATSVVGAIRKIAPNTTFDETGTSADKGKYDVAIVAIGETPYAEYNGDIKGALTLEHALSHPEDIKVLERIKKSGIPTVTLFFSGRPLCVNRELNRSDAFVAAWLPGTEADGIADVLFKNEKGAVNCDFSGKLSFSWPRGACQAPINEGDADYRPLFPYGFGLTYAMKSTVPDTLPESASKGYGCTGISIAPVKHRKPFVFFTGTNDTAAKPWIGDPSNWKGVPGGYGAHLPNISVSCMNLREEGRNNAVHLVYNDMAYWGVRHEPKDMTDLYMAGYAIAFDVKVHRKPEKKVVISVVCGFPCKASCDITGELQAGTLDE
jgi:beta-glucosidase